MVHHRTILDARRDGTLFDLSRPEDRSRLDKMIRRWQLDAAHAAKAQLIESAPDGDPTRAAGVSEVLDIARDADADRAAPDAREIESLLTGWYVRRHHREPGGKDLTAIRRAAHLVAPAYVPWRDREVA